MYKVAWYVSREIKMLQATHQCCDISILDVTKQNCNIWHHDLLCYYVNYDSFITSLMLNKNIISENCWFGRHISLPHHISVKNSKWTEQTGVAKPYACHTTFKTGVAAATPATPLPAPLEVILRPGRVDCFVPCRSAGYYAVYYSYIIV